MTFEQFQATRRNVADIDRELGFPGSDPQPGYMYEGDLHIYIDDKKPLLVIENCQARGDLAILERALFHYGVEQGILDA